MKKNTAILLGTCKAFCWHPLVWKSIRAIPLPFTTCLHLYHLTEFLLHWMPRIAMSQVTFWLYALSTPHLFSTQHNRRSTWPNWASEVLTIHNIAGIHYGKVSRWLHWRCLTVSPWLASLTWVSYFACPSKKSQMCGGWGEAVLVHSYWKSVGPLAGWMNK